jgi:UDPglucose 6-dehydrogenase
MVKITIVGSGYVGLVSGTCLAEIGHDVICCDISKEKIDMLNRGEIPIYEMGLKELVDKNVKERRLSFTSDINSAIQSSTVILSAVGTPPDENHKADLKFVREVAKSFANNLNEYKIFVNKSTVPVGTGNMVTTVIEGECDKRCGIDFDVVSNPEFLREGAAVKDFLNPDRVVVGCESEKAKEIMTQVYSPLVRMQSPLVITDIKSAELIKYAANSFLATKISFINEIARYCEIIGADVKEVAKGMGLDNRIGPKFLNAGLGYGGSCFPKDVDALYESGLEEGYNFQIINAVREVNKSQKLIMVSKLLKEIPNLAGKTISVWGLAFKPRTDDVREAPAYYIIKELLDNGAKVNVFDPVANNNFKEWFKLNINYFEDKYECISNSDALLIVTEWDEFRTLDVDMLKEKMNMALIIDGRNILNPTYMKDNGIKYLGIGR